MTTSRFWSWITLSICDCEDVGCGSEDCDDCPTRDYSRSRPAFEAIIARSGSSPLKLEVSVHGTCWNDWTKKPSIEDDSWSLKQLLLVSHRWKKLSIHPCILNLIQTDRGDLPLLEELVLEETCGSEHVSAHPQWFGNASKLHTVHAFHQDIARFLLSWSHLAHVTLGSASSRDLLHLSEVSTIQTLRLCEDGESTSIHEADTPYNPPDYGLPPIISFPNLHSLSLNGYSVDALPLLFECIIRMICPLDTFSLQTILYDELSGGEWDQERFLRLLSSHSSLKQVKLQGIPLIEQDLHSALHCLPQLEKVHILERYPCPALEWRGSDDDCENDFQPEWLSCTPHMIASLLLRGETVTRMEILCKSSSLDGLLAALENGWPGSQRAPCELILRAEEIQVPPVCRTVIARLGLLKKRGLVIRIFVGGFALADWLDRHFERCLAMRWSPRS